MECLPFPSGGEAKSKVVVDKVVLIGLQEHQNFEICDSTASSKEIIWGDLIAVASLPAFKCSERLFKLNKLIYFLIIKTNILKDF
jgi:hypothetical protein